METYEKILSRELKNGGSSSASDRQNTIEQADRVARRRQMELLVRTGLEKTKREAEVKKGIGDTLQVVSLPKTWSTQRSRLCRRQLLRGPALALPWG